MPDNATKLNAFDRVLVRATDEGVWTASYFSHYQMSYTNDTSYITINGIPWTYCLPFDGNEKLLGTTENPTPPKPKFKWGDEVQVRDYDNEKWKDAIYVGDSTDCYKYPAIKEGSKDTYLFAQCRFRQI